jgi:hypothetical protein
MRMVPEPLGASGCGRRFGLFRDRGLWENAVRQAFRSYGL